MKSSLVDITVILEHETERAWLVNDGSKKVWIPKSWGELEAKGPTWTLTLPEKFASEKGLI